jgi:nucleotide-binding universal stress UspA family protein
MDGSMIEEIMDVTEREGGERALKTKTMFDRFCTERGLRRSDAPAATSETTISWREETGREDEVVAIRGRLFDMAIVGRPVRDAALPSPITLEAALLDTGRPILVVPPMMPPVTGSHVAVAWESSPEAARALSQAMPILCKAERVTLLAPDPAEPPSIAAEEGAARLAWSGIAAHIRKFNAKEVEIGAAYLAQSKEIGSDLLIKGAYSHSRLRQMILGGRTRHILTNTEIPVFLSH